MSRDRARRAKYVVYQGEDNIWRYIGADVKKLPNGGLPLDPLDENQDVFLSTNRRGHILVYRQSGKLVIGYNDNESKSYVISEPANDADGSYVPEGAIKQAEPAHPPAQGKGIQLLAQSDIGFILIKLEDSAGNERALYIGTESYRELEERWPRADMWRRARGVTFYQTESYAPEIYVHQDSTLDFLSPIRLTENTEYFWAILSKNGTDDCSFIKDSHEMEDGDVQLGIDGEKIHPGKALTGYLRFDNYLGSASIFHAGEKILTVESTSPKIDYEDEYLRMLNDLTNEALDLILNPLSPTISHLDSNPTRPAKDIFGKYLLIKTALPLGRLKSALGTIRSNPHSVLDSRVKWLPAALSSGAYAIRDPIARIRWYSSQGGEPSPHSSLERHRVETSDTQPNRFIRYALEEFSKICDAISSREERFGPRHSMEAKAYAQECRRQLRSEFFLCCRKLARIPFDSQILQKRPGYREIFYAWTKCNLGIKIRDIAEGQRLSPDAENRDVPKLYELWLISHLRNALQNLTDDKSAKPVYRNLPRMVDGYFELYPSGGGKGKTDEPIHIIKDAHGNLVSLFYNRTFRKTLPGIYPISGPKNRTAKSGSYTVPLKPDYTVEIIWAPNGKSSFDRVTDLKSYIALASEVAPNKGGRTTYVHFDAKFKISNVRSLGQGDDERPSVDDICKMHTYNEAIYGTAASAILYPGTEATAYAKFKDLIPGIAALAVKPDRIETGDHQMMRSNAESQITSFLREIIDLAADATLTGDSKVEDTGDNHTPVYKRLRNLEIEELRSLSKSQATE